jgi:hypothetical protein
VAVGGIFFSFCTSQKQIPKPKLLQKYPEEQGLPQQLPWYNLQHRTPNACPRIFLMKIKVANQ